MNHHKLIGKVTGNNIELSCDFSRWLIGFGWLRHNPYRRIQHVTIHFNLGPLAMIITVL